MAPSSVTILGGGNTAFAVAANLQLAGTQVTLCELSAFKETLAPLQETHNITLNGVARTGVAEISEVTTDLENAIPKNDFLLVIVPAYAQRAFGEAMVPYLREGQTIVMMPGNLGSLELFGILKKNQKRDITLAETDTAPYVCRKIKPDTAHIWGVVTALGLGVFPSKHGDAVRQVLNHWVPGVTLYPNVMACGLSAMNPIVHPAGVLLNAGRIEYSEGEFFFYGEGVTHSVCRLIYAIDNERLEIATALGLTLDPVDKAFSAAGFGPEGDLWTTINESKMLTQLKAPGNLDSRWITEDVPYGLAVWCKIGEQLGLQCPLMRAVIDLLNATRGEDLWKTGRTLEDLGIAHFDSGQLIAHIN